VACATSFAITPQPSKLRLPKVMSVDIPAALANQLAVFSDTRRLMMLLAPRGWACDGIYGADGSGGLIIRPSSEAVPLTTWGAGWHLPRTSPVEAITGTQPGGSPTQALLYACSIFHAAAQGYEEAFGRRCPPHPISEHVSKVNAHVYSFEDPVGEKGLGIPSGGANPGYGVDIYYTSTLPAAYIATCTLPEAEHSLVFGCDAELHRALRARATKYGEPRRVTRCPSAPVPWAGRTAHMG
jgi:hypothetical protein